jgi:hypothetical protein
LMPHSPSQTVVVRSPFASTVPSRVTKMLQFNISPHRKREHVPEIGLFFYPEDHKYSSKNVNVYHVKMMY